MWIQNINDFSAYCYIIFLKKALPTDFSPTVYDSVFILPQTGQINFILKIKSLPILNVEDDILILSYMSLFDY